MRGLGIGLLGLLAGLLVGLIAQDLLAPLLVEDGRFTASPALAVLIGFLAPALAVGGFVAAFAVHRGVVRRRAEEER